jgi:hypothetical protein
MNRVLEYSTERTRISLMWYTYLRTYPPTVVYPSIEFITPTNSILSVDLLHSTLWARLEAMVVLRRVMPSFKNLITLANHHERLLSP